MKYRLTNIAQTAETYDPVTFRPYTNYEDKVFYARDDEQAYEKVSKWQESADKEAKLLGISDKDFELAPSLFEALVRVEIDRNGDEVEIHNSEW